VPRPLRDNAQKPISQHSSIIPCRLLSNFMIIEGQYQGNPYLSFNPDTPYYQLSPRSRGKSTRSGGASRTIRQRKPRLETGTAVHQVKLRQLWRTKMESTREKPRNIFKDKSEMENNIMKLDIIEKNCSKIKRNQVVKSISLSLLTLSVILSFKLLMNFLFPSISFGDYERTIILSSCLAVNIIASLILYKYQSLQENLADLLNNVIKQVKTGNVERLLVDTMETVLDANQKMERLLGSSGAEPLTMNHTQVPPQEEPERSRGTLEKVFQTGQSDQANSRKIGKDDRRVPVNFVTNKMECGDKPLIQGIFRDVTVNGKPDQIQAQQYREHLSFLQNFFKIPSA
jgi:PAS domain S-box-containing protein